MCLVASAARGVAATNLPVTIEPSPLREFYLQPTRIVWQSEDGIQNPGALLAQKPGQTTLTEPLPPCVLISATNSISGVLLDFGKELQGFVEIFTPQYKDKKPRRVRVRFGESASEAMTDIGVKGAQNDHGLRDQIVTLPWLGKMRAGPSGFRFVRIDAEPGPFVSISQVRAVLQLRDVPQTGSFKCDDERLNRIWAVGAYTVHLNMQEYLWDGIKRDRLVWAGDMHPEVSVINAVFGFNDVVPRSLDLTRDSTPPGQWMNGISSYSMWWVLIHEQWWLHHGDRAYLEQQKSHMQALLKRLASLVGEDGREHLDGMRFLDWPSSSNEKGVTAGLQALLVMTLDSGSRLMTALGDAETSRLCTGAAARARKIAPDVNGLKSAAALQVLAGLSDPKKTSADVLKADGAKNISTFYGFYVLQALAKAGETDAALDIIRNYWGAMLDRGATTFWEDFNPDWLVGSGRIDELTPPDKKDLHGDFGAYCYEGFRHSLCHGWAGGPTAWLSEIVLGVRPLEPGCRRVLVSPQLGSLKRVEGAYPTPLGPIKLLHERQPDGSIKSRIEAPPGVEIVRP